MRQHSGEHPRIGATDVVPFVPVADISMQECVRLANRYGKRVGDELGIAMYLYEEAATRPERRNLATVRKGEYEGLAAKLQDPAWQPDYGPTTFNARSGATVTGARMFLIAYNVNLSTNDPAIAHDIALHIRESGRAKKDEQGKVVLDHRGQKVMIPGSLKGVKAMGVLLEAQNIAQVSINLVNYHVTPPHVAFEEVKRQASLRGIRATGSEIVGLTPKEALLMAGSFYAPAIDEERALIEAAIEHLGLRQLERFDVNKKVIEYQLEG
jgi:glutamate formiminotransferase/formiminotetrahydrofolate cyclodeaminase